MPVESPMLWTPVECAKWLRVCLRTLDALRRQGMPCYRLGRQLRFDPVAVKGWLAEHAQAGAAAEGAANE